jgi:hypothetical protein
MSSSAEVKGLLHESRPRVYLLWAFLTGAGYTATQFYQHPNINIIWIVISIIGLGYMYKVMPLRIKQMKQIFLAWLIPIVFGIAVSVIAARTDLLPNLLGYLGGFWLLITAIGFVWNGIVDPPGRWYYVAATVHVIAGILIFTYAPLQEFQYAAAAAVSVWSMLNLWIFRSSA